MIDIGFTGTQQDSTHAQSRTTFDWLVYLRKKHKKARARHGDCIGADATFYRQVRALGIPRIIHPCDIDAKRAFVHRSDADWPGQVAKTIILDALPPLDRNKNIVDQSGILLAHPKSDREEHRSGTWSTVRYARRIGRHIVIIWPNGLWTEERAKIDPIDTHVWDGDSCTVCEIDNIDFQAMQPRCGEWRPKVELCSVCNEPQFMTPSGETCSNGHGGAPSVTVLG